MQIAKQTAKELLHARTAKRTVKELLSDLCVHAGQSGFPSHTKCNLLTVLVSEVLVYNQMNPIISNKVFMMNILLM